MKPLAYSLLLSGVFVLSACGGSPTPTESTDAIPPVDSPSLVEPDDMAAILARERGKVVVLNVWATWCPPCVAEMPALVAFHKSVNKDEVAMIGLSADDPAEVESEVQPFLESKGVTYPNYILATFDPEAYAPALKTELDGSIPVTLFYDKQGELKRTHTGVLDEGKLREIVAALAR